MSPRFVVMLYDFVNLPDGSRESCCNGEPDGFNVWLRDNEPGNGEPFDSVDEWDADFKTEDAARLYAEALAAKFETEIDEY